MPSERNERDIVYLRLEFRGLKVEARVSPLVVWLVLSLLAV